jgi:hypothetical protein
MLKRFTGTLMVLLAFVFPITACDTGTEGRFGSLSILLTDEPGELLEAWVTITGIYLQGDVGEQDPPQGRYYLMTNGEDAAVTVELLSLANKVFELVGNKPVPAGTYGQLRVVLSDGCVVTQDGDIYRSSPGYTACEDSENYDDWEVAGSLQMPSFAQTGAKVLLNGFTVTTGGQSLLLDFDVSQSFGRLAGASGKWVMTPVIHAEEIGLTVGVTATLALAENVTLPGDGTLADFSATLTPTGGDESTVDFTFVESNDTFEAHFRFLIPDNGPFDLELNWPGGLTGTVSPEPLQEGLNPASGQIVTIEWVIETAVEDEE